MKPVLLFEGELNSDDILVATKLRFKIFYSCNGEKRELLSPHTFLDKFKGACGAEFATLTDDKEEIILSAKDREALIDLNNMVTYEGFVYMSVVPQGIDG